MKKMNINELEQHIFAQLKIKTKEYQRAFHGRGNFHEGFEFLTVDFIDDVLFVVFFNVIDEGFERNILKIIANLYDTKEFKCAVLQRRYLDKSPSEILHGKLPSEVYAYENNLKFQLNFMTNQNIGFFHDMKVGHEFISSICKDKKVLNLFSYTCAFSVCAIANGAQEVVNVDMSKPSLTMGRVNHRINNLDTKKVKFMPHNILKSWNKIKKSGPYDIIVIDPPSFQKGSFAATNDYEKIIKRLDELGSSDCTVLACLNAPELDTFFIKNLFAKVAFSFKYEKRLKNLDSFVTSNEEKTLKNLIFKRVKND